MYLLDTNVVSEFGKIQSGRADPHVAAWAAEVDVEALYLSVVTIMEIETGISRLERRDARQADMLYRWLRSGILPKFSSRLLAVDLAVARRVSRLQVPKPRPLADAFIAATAAVHGLQLVTRNRADFAGCDVDVIDPWSPQ